MLAGVELKRLGLNPTVYTFGQPRVGLKGFADKVDVELSGRYFRVVNQRDIVARLPPGLLYRHCGKVKRIVRPGRLESKGATDGVKPVLTDVDLPPISEEVVDESFLDDLDGFSNSAKSLEGRAKIFNDHRMVNYIKLLIEIAESET